MEGINLNVAAHHSATQSLNPVVVAQNAATAKSQAPLRTKASAVDGFDRLAAQPLETELGPVMPQVRGRRAGRASNAGFKVSEIVSSGKRYVKRHVKAIAIASAIGFALLVPPGVGQIMHPGFPGSKTSPVAVQMTQMQKLPAAQRVRQQVDIARKAILPGTGAAREKAVLGLIQQYETAKANAAKADAISGKAQTAMGQMRKSVSWDARAGYAIDWYWFGVPEQNAFYHAGTKDATTLSKTASADEQAASYANNAARDEVSNLLVAESPAYASLHANYVHTGDQLTAAETIQRKAEQASSDVSYAQYAEQMFASTPQWVEHQYQDANGNYYTETDTNPDWLYWQNEAMAAENDAAASLAALRREVSRDSGLLNLNGMLVREAENNPDAVARKMGPIIGQLKPKFEQLQSQVNQKIDARWQQLVQSNLNS